VPTTIVSSTITSSQGTQHDQDTQHDRGLATVGLFCGLGLLVSLGLIIALGSPFKAALSAVLQSIGG
jgi:hypothetical protein